MNYSDFKTKYNIRLNVQQEAAVQTVDGAVLLLAVPGSGKTTALVARLGYMILCRGIQPERILTMTYTTAATADMRSRFAEIFGDSLAAKLGFRTINSLCVRIIRYFEQTLGRKAFDLITNEGELNALVAGIYRNVTGDFATDSTVKIIRTEITYIKNMQLSDEEIDELKSDGIDLAPLYREYCRVLRERRLMDYDDQLVYACQMLRQFPGILHAFQKQYPYICVDEAQDTSKIQHSIIALLTGEHGNLFMVGDEDQSIYGFRAAYPEALLKFDQIHANAKILLLEQNFRSTRQIVQAADSFIQKNRNRRAKHMVAVCGKGADIRIIDVENRLEQYDYLTALARSCSDDTAVLYRNNDSALPLIDRMDREGVAYRCRKFDTSFFSHRVVRDITDIIRFAYEPNNGEIFMRIYYKFGLGISKVAAEAASAHGRGTILGRLAKSPDVQRWQKEDYQKLQNNLNELKHFTGDLAVHYIVQLMGYGEYLGEHEIDDSKIPILEAIGVAQPTPMYLLERLDELSVITQDDTKNTNEGIILSTIHSAKGLEYDNVYLMDVADNILPNCPVVLPDEKDQEGLSQYEEERRLFYVGMTRAKSELSIFRFNQADLFSTFVDELVPQNPPKATSRQVQPKSTPNPADEQKIRRLCEELVPGVWVRHVRFGRGIIVAKESDIVSIRFVNGEIRRFSLDVALRQNQLNVIL